MLAYHVNTAIRSALSTFASDIAAWRRALSAGPSIPTAAANALHAAIFPTGVNTIPVGESWTEDFVKTGGILIEDAESPISAVPLAQYVGTDSEKQPLFGGQHNGTATIYVHHRSLDTCLALWCALRAVAATWHRQFVAVGYTSLQYAGGGALALQEQLVRGWVGQGIRTFTLRAEYRVAVRDETAGLLEQKPLFVAPVDITGSAGAAGGMQATQVEE